MFDRTSSAITFYFSSHTWRDKSILRTHIHTHTHMHTRCSSVGLTWSKATHNHIHTITYTHTLGGRLGGRVFERMEQFVITVVKALKLL